MKRYLGASKCLPALVKTHLFVISPNNSGSTFLQNILKLSKSTWNLEREGQHVFGYSGPSANALKMPLIWASQQETLDRLLDKESYNWVTTKKAWYFQAFSISADASVFTTKAPPFLLLTDELKKYFFNTKFIFLVRNPYAVVEGISRRKTKNILNSDDIFTVAATHIMKCFEYQKQNIETYTDALFFSYEQMCDETEKTQKRLKAFMPELSDVTLQQKVAVKGIYDEVLRNMNAQQIDRLTTENIKIVNKVFLKHQELMDYFGYEIIHTL